MAFTKDDSGPVRMGRPPKEVAPEDKLKMRSLYLTDPQWQYCQKKGGSEFVRGLVDADRGKGK